MRLVDNNMNIDIRIQNGPNPLKISQLGQEKKKNRLSEKIFNFNF